MLEQTLPAPVRYEIDAADIIRALSPAWNAFAEENTGHDLAPERVLGRSLWDYIVGDDTAALYRLLLAHIRQTARTITFLYRCDSPELRRFMRMSIEPVAPDRIGFTSVLYRCEPRDRAVHMTYAGIAAAPLVLRCSMCNQIRVRGGEWMDVAAAFQRGDILNTDIPVRVAYSICESCGRTISAMCFARPR